ncbi:MAG TPA: four helix bundle protein [Phycisphaerales bacterium]|nr:four helix bundle protein [Phycisphaerales bacterium]
MASVKRVEDLIAWQKDIALCKLVYKASARFPDAEKFGLQSQIRRAAVSVPSNIAEGFGRQSTNDLIRFLKMARGSLFEVRTQFVIAVELAFISSGDVPTDLIDETDRVLQGLIRSLEDRTDA